MQKKKIATIGVVIATVILAGIAVFTAVRLYQLRQESVSPAAPESEPAAAEPVTESCELLTFNLGAGVICEAKTAYRNDDRNTAGNYYLEGEIAEGETVEPGEIILFGLIPGPSGITKAITITDILPSNLTFLDSDNECSFSSGNNTLTCTLGGTDTQVAFRATVADDATETITNTATFQGEGDEPSTCSTSLTLEGSETTPPTSTPTDTPTTPPTGTETPDPALPEAGISFPTILSSGLGILIILGSLILIF
jgi:hypothetical protein